MAGRGRQPDGRPSIYKTKDGWWECYFPTGERYPNGRPKRKHIKHRTAGEVADAIDALVENLRKGHDVTSKVWTFAQWLSHYLENIIMQRVRIGSMSRNTYDDYESISRVWLIPLAGGRNLKGRRNRLEPEDLEAIYAAQAAAGKSKSYIHRTHAVARRALKVAYRRGRADRIVTELMDSPEKPKARPRPLQLGEAQAVLAEAVSDRDGLAARWLLGILGGPRSGEACGIHWTETVLDPEPGELPHIMPATQVQRFSWLHGCDDPVVCNRTREDAEGQPKNPCKTRACPPMYVHGCADPNDCKKYAHFCPDKTVVPNKCARHKRLEHCKPCPQDCADHASTCPKRRDGGVVEVGLKTDSSSEPMPLAGVLVDLLRTHREKQIQAFAAAGRKWSPEVHLFLDKNLKPIDGKRDWDAWQALLSRAKVKRYRLHDARHTTGTFLRATGSDLKMVKEVLRQAQLSVADGYTGEAMVAKQAAVERMAAALLKGDLTKILGAQNVALP